MTQPADIPEIDQQDQYFRNHFNTELSPEEEFAFQASERANDTTDYDMRGAWKAGIGKSGNGHFPDTYKKPNHPTFSDQSQYSGAPDEMNGGTWQGGTWGDGTYTPSAKMLSTTQTPDSLREYMNRVEPDATLVLPEDTP